GPGADEIEHLGRRIAVRNKRGLQAMAARHLEHVERPLGGDERLVVGRPDELRSLSQREPNQVVRGDVGRDYAGGVVAQRLAREPVLAIPTVEIASQHTEGECVGAGEGVEERLLLGRIALQGGDVAGGDVQRPVLVEADLADPPAPGLDEATVPAREAAHRVVGKPLDQLPLADPGVQRLGEGRRPAVPGEGSFVGEERDDAALRHGIRRLRPFLNIARRPRAQPPTRSGPGARSWRSAVVRTSRGESSRTLGWAYMMSPGSGEWSRPIRCPISCSASTRTSSGANRCPLASKVARVTTPPVRRPSSSHCTSVCPERSPSNWMRHWTRTSAELESASRLNRTGTTSCQRWKALRTASWKLGWKLATVVGGKNTRTGVDTRPSQRCRIESAFCVKLSFRYVLPALARIRRRISERARSTM